jgi:glycosyltransferase involved in cell wall biosynthesis/predicted O-methyltransferase YrrM
VRDSSADALRRVQLRGSLARLERVLRSGRQPGTALLRQLSHGWGNEAWSASVPLLGATLEWFARTSGSALECGTGLTTLALAAAANASGRTLLSLEHDDAWAARARDALPADLRPAVTVATTPIRSYGAFDWYALEGCELPESIGFVLCDGPPGSTRGGRYGLGPVLARRLAPGCIVLLDDTQRSEEHSIVQRWCSELDARVIDEASTFTVLRIGRFEPTREPAADLRGASGERTGVIALVPDQWRGIWTTRHQVLHRLARHFDVAWVEPARPWKEFWLPHGAHRESPADGQDIAPDPNCTIYDPGRWLPQVYRPAWLRDWIRRARVRRAQRILRKRGCTRIILSVWRPQFDWALDAIAADLTCYHIDDEYSFTPIDQPNDAAEVALIRRVDQVFVHSRSLLGKKGGINPHTVYMSNGVDYRSFSTPAPEPPDLAAIPHPRVGYVGVLKKQLDLSLLLQLAQRHPQWSFVGVGPVGSLGESAALFVRLRQMRNVYLLGNRPLEALPGYVQHMDVCAMPYVVDGYTKFINPIKMYEYLATGRPIVSTPIDCVMPFADVVRIASTVEQWEAELLAKGADATETATRRARAAEYDWGLIADRVAAQLRDRLNQLYAAPTTIAT